MATRWQVHFTTECSPNLLFDIQLVEEWLLAIVECNAIQQIRIDAYKEFKADVDSGAFPPPECVVEVEDEEYEKFMDQVDKAG